MILSSFVAEGVCTCAPGGAPVCMIRLACWRCCCTPVLGRVGWHVGAEGSGSSRAAAGRVGQSGARAGTWPTSSATGSLSTGSRAWRGTRGTSTTSRVRGRRRRCLAASLLQTWRLACDVCNCALMAQTSPASAWTL